MDHGGQTCVEFGRGLEKETFLDGGVELREELINSSMGDFGEKASERKKINSGLVEGIGEMSRINIWDKACFVGKGKGVQMSVGETM